MILLVWSCRSFRVQRFWGFGFYGLGFGVHVPQSVGRLRLDALEGHTSDMQVADVIKGP